MPAYIIVTPATLKACGGRNPRQQIADSNMLLVEGVA